MPSQKEYNTGGRSAVGQQDENQMKQLLKRPEVHFRNCMIEGVHSTGLQSQHTVAKKNRESWSLLAVFLRRVA